VSSSYQGDAAVDANGYGIQLSVSLGLALAGGAYRGGENANKY